MGLLLIQKKHYYAIGYCNTSKILIDQFVNDMSDVYGMKPTDIREREQINLIARYCSIAIVKDLERYLTSEGDLEVLSRDFINNLSDTWKIIFLRAFWDDEGTVRFAHIRNRDGYVHTHRKVEAFQKNTEMLNQIREMHQQLGINTYINKNKIIISDRVNLIKFKDLIHFTNGVVTCKTTSKWYGTEKNEILRLAVESYEK